VSQVDIARKLDTKIGSAVAVNIAFDEGLIVHGPGTIVLHKVQFSCLVAKSMIADEGEMLVAAYGPVRVNGAEVKIVDAVCEVSDHVSP
jgi:hypothetical protein